MTDQASRPTRPSLAAALSFVIPIVPFGVGLWIGREIAYREGETGNAFYTIGARIEVGGLAVLLGLVGAIAFARRQRRIGGLAFGSAAALVAGTFVAAQLANPLGLGYRAPVVHRGAGVATVALDQAPGFVAKASASVTCVSVPDATAVGGVEGLDFGELGSGTLRGTLGLEPDGSGGHIELFIDGADLADGAPQPSWAGAVGLRDLAADRAAGTAVFSELRYDDPEVSKGGPVPTGGPWPLTLSGTLHWECPR